MGLVPLGGRLIKVGSSPLAFVLGAHPSGLLGRGVAPSTPIFNQNWPMLPLGQRPKDADSSRHG